MLKLSGYQIRQKLDETARSLIFQGYRESDNQPIIIKWLKEDYPSAATIARFKREHEITRQLDLSGVVGSYDLEFFENKPVIILEDFGGIPLKRYIVERQLALSEILTLAIKLAAALGSIHQRRVIHKDLNPSNIVLNPQTGQLKIIDFGIATVLSRETPSFSNPDVLEGTLAYMSPEQTGRMNRSVDYRTDFYSLGVTLYELVTGQLPFVGDDAMSLVHAHIARQPAPPHQLNPRLPTAVSQIIMKLLAKNARDRYQSARGLQDDLEKCLAQWEEKQAIEPFPLGAEDYSDHFRAPQTLYGREAEITILLESLERAAQGASEMLLVAGYPGVGKTALVQECYKPITSRRGYFIAGKFDLLQRNIPYSSLIQAFRGLARQILTESETQVAAWRGKLLAAFGPNGQIIVDVIPEVALIIGPQPPAPELAAAESQNRFNLLFLSLIRVFAAPGHPLVIFLDDLQWADAASLKLLQLLMTDADGRCLFIIGAYRDNEVSATHPLQLAIREMQKGEAKISQISLPPLGLPAVSQFVADALHSDREETRPLAELLLAKTNGNPFFMNEFLRTLYHDGALAFDYGRRAWQWDIADIKRRELTDNVIQFMANKVQQLEPVVQRALYLAACIGNQFDLPTLAIVSQKSPQELAADLWPAMIEGLLLPVGDAYKWAEWENGDAASGEKAVYRFAHDRIQQAVYSLIPSAEKQTVHLQIGRLLLANDPSQREQHLFDIVNHLNLGCAFIDQQADRHELAALNLLAGRKAQASAAYEAALAYLTAGLNLLADDAWTAEYDLALGLYTAAAEAAYLCANFTQMEQLAASVKAQARLPLDQIKLYEVEIQANIARNKLRDALTIALEGLRLLGERFPDQPQPADVQEALAEVKAALAGREIGDLLTLPEMPRLDKRAAMRLMSRVFSAAFLAAPEFFPLIVSRQTRLSIRHGNTPESAFAYAAYGLILCGLVEDVESGYQFGRLALDLLERTQDTARRARVLELVHAFITHWQEHVQTTLEPLLEAYQVGLQTGDLGNAAYAAFVRVYHMFAIGRELPEVEREMAVYSEAVARLQQETVLNLNNLYWQVTLNLQGKTPDPCRFLGDVYDEAEMLPRHQAAGDRGSLFHYHFNKLILYYLFQQYEEAAAATAVAEEYLESVTASLPFPLFYFYDSLARLAVFTAASPAKQSEIAAKVEANQKKLDYWATHAPMNYRHKHFLVEAEMAHAQSRHGEARELYDKAISLAREHKYLQEEALANELAGRYYLAREQLPQAQLYLWEARYLYGRWGAHAKMFQMDEQYPPRTFQTTAAPAARTLQQTQFTLTTSGQGVSNDLDLSSVIKASQAISSEIELEGLLATLLRIVIENAGAQRGWLLLRQENELRLTAVGEADLNAPRLIAPTPLSDIGPDDPLRLSTAIVNYVARAKESVVLNDARAAARFAHTAYIQERQPKSVLAVPLLHQGDLLGVIYMENNLATGVFTPNRVEIVGLLGTQAAISIANAHIIAARAEQERLQLENEFLERQSQDLARLNADKDKFFSIVSHDLRGPFSSLLTGSEMLLLRLNDLTLEEIRERAQYMHNSSRAAYNLLENLLAWSKLQMGRMVYDPGDVSLALLARNTVDLLRGAAVAKEIALSHDISPTLRVHADRYMIETVIRNLAGNAIKFTPQGGAVTITADEGDEVVTVSVSDTGIGMNGAEMAKLFRIDVHFTRPGTAKESGSGLGLTICKEMVEKNNGRIWVESVEGQGTTIRFTLPNKS